MNRAIAFTFLILFTTVEVHAKRLVLCLDGTGGSAYNEQKRSDGHILLKPSNPLKMCRAVLPSDPATGVVQLTYYDTGVGSLAKYPGPANRLLAFADRKYGGAWGAGFEGNVEDALHFINLNYEKGDEVYIFGFSRGAATALGVTTFLEWNGGLPVKGDSYYLPQLFRAFVDAHGVPEAAAKAHADIRVERLQPFNAVPVTYLGVWDTVMALGSRFEAKGASTSSPGRTFYAGKAPPTCVLHARQALSIDERRYDFRPEIWTEQHPGQIVRQRWFAGVHTNVGGGYNHDGLANITFHWLLDGAKEAGLQVDSHYVSFYRPFALASLYDSDNAFYKFLDALRGRAGKGKREISGVNFDIDPTVFQRMLADPAKLQEPQKLYRPENVIRYLSTLPDVDAYLRGIGFNEALPEDVKKKVEKK